MTDLDKLRAALHEPPAHPFAPPDLARIIADGKRIRRRRRLATGAGAVAAVAAVVGIVFGAAFLRTPGEPAPTRLPALAAPSASASAAPSYAPTSSTYLPPPKVLTQPEGDVIATGTKTHQGELGLYAYRFDEPSLPDVHFGVMAATQAGKTLRPLYASNEVRGSDRSFGFHTTAGGLTINDVFVPVFGYFSGPAARITSTVRGKPVDAHVAKRSQDPSVVVFWFDQSAVPCAAQLTPPVAYAANGSRLTK
ncbi:hypothetical protein [Amycolatopsis sp. FDAARGOS 1241]|uniref:hypothetical protein n=1 Tax=Amycolatopsis sp. FDAARGOS 1241 TaxID=2778070 RepID=UPI00194E6FD6|nr:hypothetical protein [Amycolatopsis sp. FDAARGOS 1241]QRP45862.1 hypothetical protein I6J71_43465 [Amycolatopsis sp. FDAARGOS 1241]